MSNYTPYLINYRQRWRKTEGCKYHESPGSSDTFHHLISKAEKVHVFKDYRLVYCVFSESVRGDVILFDNGEPITGSTIRPTP